jgi:hypothetical protein
MPATLYTVELAPVFLACGSGDDIHQDIRGDVRLAHNAPQSVIPLQKRPRCMVEKIHTQHESSPAVEAGQNMWHVLISVSTGPGHCGNATVGCVSEGPATAYPDEIAHLAIRSQSGSSASPSSARPCSCRRSLCPCHLAGSPPRSPRRS